jgi:hypothetical protein
MNLPLKLNRRIVRLLMVLALFAQWVIPGSVYAALPVAPAAAMKMQPAMSCHSGQAGHEACLTHCSQADQVSLDHAHLAAPPASLAVWRAAVPPAPLLSGGALLPAGPHFAASPPLPILYCSLLN